MKPGTPGIFFILVTNHLLPLFILNVTHPRKILCDPVTRMNHFTAGWLDTCSAIGSSHTCHLFIYSFTYLFKHFITKMSTQQQDACTTLLIAEGFRTCGVCSCHVSMTLNLLIALPEVTVSLPCTEALSVSWSGHCGALVSGTQQL